MSNDIFMSKVAVPEIIEIDQGRAIGWLRATVIKADARSLHYKIGDGPTRKLPLAGRGMVWRAAS